MLRRAAGVRAVRLVISGKLGDVGCENGYVLFGAVGASPWPGKRSGGERLHVSVVGKLRSTFTAKKNCPSLFFK